MVERIVGTNAAETLRAFGSSDHVMFGRGGSDNLYGGSGNDRLLGGRGGDTLYSSSGQDILLGGAGNDTYVLQASAGGFLTIIQEEPNNGYDLIRIQTYLVTFSIPENVEAVELNANVDFFWGNEVGNLIDASSRSSGMSIDGLGGRDKILGTRSHDLIDGGKGADRMEGGTGYDTYRVDNVKDRVIEDPARNEYDTVISTVSYHIPKGVEYLGLAGNATRATGNGADNSLVGNARANTLDGRGGDDYLVGGAGRDALLGGAGDDLLIGGRGADRLTGGGGADVFVFLTAKETGSTRKTADVIRDLGSGDRIDLSAVDAASNRSNEQSFDFIGAAGFGKSAGELRYDGRFLIGDRDGDGSGDFYIKVTGGLSQVEDALIV
jgi:Ca2+-binding RTX toxin-like protein